MSDDPTPPRKPDVLDHYRDAWDVFRRDPVPWVVFSTVFLAVTLFTCGLGGLQMVPYTRETGAALREGRAPQVGAIFDFSRLGTDLVAALIWSLAMSFGASLAGIGGAIAALALQFLTPIAAEDRYEPVQAAQLSIQHVLGNVKDHLVFALVSWAGAFVAISTFFVLFPVVLPLLSIAHWRFWESEREVVEALAVKAGYTPREGALPAPQDG